MADKAVKDWHSGAEVEPQNQADRRGEGPRKGAFGHGREGTLSNIQTCRGEFAFELIAKRMDSTDRLNLQPPAQLRARSGFLKCWGRHAPHRGLQGRGHGNCDNPQEPGAQEGARGLQWPQGANTGPSSWGMRRHTRYTKQPVEDTGKTSGMARKQTNLRSSQRKRLNARTLQGQCHNIVRLPGPAMALQNHRKDYKC